MKNVTLLILLLFITSSFTQTKSYEEYLIAGKWTPAYKVFGDKKKAFPKERKGEMWISFFKNGKFQVFKIEDIEGVIKEVKGEYGTWKFLKEKSLLISKSSNRKTRDTLVIESITEKEMTINQKSKRKNRKVIFENMNKDL